MRYLNMLWYSSIYKNLCKECLLLPLNLRNWQVKNKFLDKIQTIEVSLEVIHRWCLIVFALTFQDKKTLKSRFLFLGFLFANKDMKMKEKQISTIVNWQKSKFDCEILGFFSICEFLPEIWQRIFEYRIPI